MPPKCYSSAQKQAEIVHLIYCRQADCAAQNDVGSARRKWRIRANRTRSGTTVLKDLAWRGAAVLEIGTGLPRIEGRSVAIADVSLTHS